jgi:hypothetical protein
VLDESGDAPRKRTSCVPHEHAVACHALMDVTPCFATSRLNKCNSTSNNVNGSSNENRRVSHHTRILAGAPRTHVRLQETAVSCHAPMEATQCFAKFILIKHQQGCPRLQQRKPSCKPLLDIGGVASPTRRRVLHERAVSCHAPMDSTPYIARFVLSTYQRSSNTVRGSSNENRRGSHNWKSAAAPRPDERQPSRKRPYRDIARCT